MSLRLKTETALGQLAGAALPQALSVQEGARRLICDMTALDSIGCSFRGLVLESDALAEASNQQLRAIADDLSRRVNYLLEPIAPIEVDPEQCLVQMRSSPPQKSDGQSTYYELLVRRGGELSLRRYAKDRQGQRTVVPATVTREVFLRLVGDFEAAAP